MTETELTPEQIKACYRLEKAKKHLSKTCLSGINADLIDAIDSAMVVARGGGCNPKTGRGCT